MERHGEFVNQLSQCLEDNRKFSEIPTGFKNLSFQSSLLQNAWTKDVLSNLDKLDPSTWTTSKINTGLVVPLSVQQKKKRMESLQLLEVLRALYLKIDLIQGHQACLHILQYNLWVGMDHY